ncbi:MAG: hypothetical protein R2818_09640 [Flavobacteriales bacterium]
MTKIGFKWICGIMINEDVLLGGEESGGIAIKVTSLSAMVFGWA